MRRHIALSLILALLPRLALAQGAPVYQSGETAAAHDVAKLTRQGEIQDAGGVTGDINGQGVNPFAVQDNGGLGLCVNSAKTSASYHFGCIGHDTNGNLQWTIDGVTSPIPTTASSIGLGVTNSPTFVGLTLSQQVFTSVNHDPTHDPAGYNIGALFADVNPASGLVGANPQAGNAVLASLFIDNTNNRSHEIWALNINAGLWGTDIGGSSTQGQAIEIDTYSGLPVGTPTDPYGSGPYDYGITFVASLNTDPTTTWPNTALWIWSQRGPSHNREWWYNGLSCARVYSACIVMKDDTADGDAPGSSFSLASIADYSSSPRVLYLGGGSHSTAVIDASGLTSMAAPFLLLPSAANSTVSIRNEANFSTALVLDSGISAAEESQFVLADQNNPQWALTKPANDTFQLFDPTGLGTTRLTVTHAGVFTFNGTVGLTQATWADNQSCVPGQISVDASFVYACTATNTVKRAALSSF